MKIGSPIEEKKARIEIIPLIDIMFFLLACFMAVSLSMIQMRGMRVALPTGVNTQPEQKDDFMSITVDAAATVWLEKERIDDKAELTRRIKALHEQDQELRVYIRADKDSTHGEVIAVLDAVRSAGVSKVAFELQAKTQIDPNKAPAPTPAVPAVPAVPSVPAVPPAAPPAPGQ
jgi:biopolymer transport protein ExbD